MTTSSFIHSETAPEKPVGEFSVGQRQLAALGFIAFLLLGFASTMAYVAGRVARNPQAPAPVAAAAAPVRQRAAVPLPVPASRPAVEQLIMVETASSTVASPAGAIPSAPAAGKPVAVTAQLEKPAASTPVSPHQLTQIPTELLKGNTYWQVAAIDRGMAEVSCEFLLRKELPALLGDSPTPGIVRVLVGPIHTPDETAKYKALLEESGFHPFIKKY